MSDLVGIGDEQVFILHTAVLAPGKLPLFCPSVEIVPDAASAYIVFRQVEDDRKGKGNVQRRSFDPLSYYSRCITDTFINIIVFTSPRPCPRPRCPRRIIIVL